MASNLPVYQREYIVQLLALGNTKPQIIEKFEDRYGRRIHPTTIIRLKKKYRRNIHDAHDIIAAGSDMVGAAALKQKSYRLLDRKLDQAIEDQTELDKLRLRLKAGEITKQEFDRESERYEVLTINELTKVADSMHTHTKQNNENEPLTPQDQAALQLLVEGIKSGNPFQLVQVINPRVRDSRPSAENPVPQPGNSAPSPA